MNSKAHYNPKSKRQLVSFVIMLVLSVAVVFGSIAIKNAVDEKNNGTVDVNFTISKSVPVSVKDNDLGVTAVEEVYNDKNEVVAYVINGTTVGYNAESPIEMATTITADGKVVCGVDILKQEETEYLGVRIATDNFKNQFEGKKIPVVSSNGIEKGSKVDVIAKSTISSEAVITGVDNAAEYVTEFLAK